MTFVGLDCGGQIQVRLSCVICKVFLIFPGTSSPILIPHLAMPEADFTRGVICF